MRDFASLIAKNTTIETLDIDLFCTSNIGFFYLFEALKHNKTIKHLKVRCSEDSPNDFIELKAISPTTILHLISDYIPKLSIENLYLYGI